LIYKAGIYRVGAGRSFAVFERMVTAPSQVWDAGSS